MIVICDEGPHVDGDVMYGTSAAVTVNGNVATFDFPSQTGGADHICHAHSVSQPTADFIVVPEPGAIPQLISMAIVLEVMRRRHGRLQRRRTQANGA